MKKYIKSSTINGIDVDSYKEQMYKLAEDIQYMADCLTSQCDKTFDTIPTRLDAIEKHDSLAFTRAAYGKNSAMLEHYCDVITDETKELRGLYYELENSLGLWSPSEDIVDEEEADRLIQEQMDEDRWMKTDG